MVVRGLQGAIKTTAPSLHFETLPNVMPRLQAIVCALAGKNRQKSPIPQFERKVIALLPHDFPL